eukprot:jgi/Mesvir1/14909/Mv05507-RA.2
MSQYYSPNAAVHAHIISGTSLPSFAVSGRLHAGASVSHSTGELRRHAALSHSAKRPLFRPSAAPFSSAFPAGVTMTSRPSQSAIQPSAGHFRSDFKSDGRPQPRRASVFRCMPSGKENASDDDDDSIVFDEDSEDEEEGEEDEDGEEADEVDGELDATVLDATAKLAGERAPITYERISEGLNLQKADYTISSLVAKYHRGKLELQPSFQRDFVWDRKMASRLIESLLLGIPVPTIFMHEMERGMLEVVDGRQRLTSICGYVDGIFPDGKEFRLTGCENLKELNGLLYSELTEECQEVRRLNIVNASSRQMWWLFKTDMVAFLDINDPSHAIFRSYYFAVQAMGCRVCGLRMPALSRPGSLRALSIAE